VVSPDHPPARPSRSLAAVRSRAASGLIALLIAGVAGGTEPAPEPLPLGLPARAARIPADNPPTAEKIALGKQLFWDPRWSRNGTVACVSCHDPDHGWADPRRFSVRFDGMPTPRRSATLVNRLFAREHQWAGNRTSLEDQAGKVADALPPLMVNRLGAVPAYREQFRRVFGTELNADGVNKAIAAYERTILSGNAPYDRFRAGDADALSPSARRGLALFEGRAGCAACHAGFNFTDEGFHNLGIGMDAEAPDLGRYTVTGVQRDKGAFKTPTLRDVALRPPYMHDGSLATLAEVVAFYDGGGMPNPWLSPGLEPLGLTAREQADLVAFLESLTGQVDPEVSRPPELPDPFAS
jgi:cytochrome c peroxidase